MFELSSAIYDLWINTNLFNQLVPSLTDTTSTRRCLLDTLLAEAFASRGRSRTGGSLMSKTVDWNEVRSLLETLYCSSDRLEALFPSRKFTLDGHLVGSIGEVIAEYMFDLNLLKGSNKGYDAKTNSGRQVEIKFTQGNDGVGLRHEPEHLLVLQRIKGSRVQIVFNGPGNPPWAKRGRKQKNGQHFISLRTLGELDNRVLPADRLTQIREAPI